MSDTPHGADWWLASDGKWYPPTARPGAPLPPPPPPPPGGISSRPSSALSGLSGTLQVFMWIAAATLAISALLGIGGSNALDTANNSTWRNFADSWQTVENVETAIVVFWLLQNLLALIIFVLIIVWSHRAYSVSEALRANDRSFGSGWAVGGWFIPLANALLPRLVLRDIEKAIAQHSSTWSGGAQSSPPGALGWVWWVSFVVCNALYVLGYGRHGAVDGDYESWQTGYLLLAAGGGGLAVSSVLGALYIRGLTKSLNLAAASA